MKKAIILYFVLILSNNIFANYSKTSIPVTQSSNKVSAKGMHFKNLQPKLEIILVANLYIVLEEASVTKKNANIAVVTDCYKVAALSCAAFEALEGDLDCCEYGALYHLCYSICTYYNN